MTVQNSLSPFKPQQKLILENIATKRVHQKNKARRYQIKRRLGHSLWSVDGITGIPDERHEYSMVILNAMDEFSEWTSVRGMG